MASYDVCLLMGEFQFEDANHDVSHTLRFIWEVCRGRVTHSGGRVTVSGGRVTVSGGRVTLSGLLGKSAEGELRPQEGASHSQAYLALSLQKASHALRRARHALRLIW